MQNEMQNTQDVLKYLVQYPEDCFTGKHDEMINIIDAAIKQKLNIRVEHIEFMEHQVARLYVESKK